MRSEDQRRQELVTLFHSAPICRSYGMRMSYDAEGHAVFDLPYNTGFDHALGGIHGGVIATLLDNAGWFTLAPAFETWIATVEFTTRLLEPVARVDLRSIGRVVRLGKSLSTAEMEVRTRDGRLVATGAGTFATTSVPFTKVPEPGVDCPTPQRP